MSEDGSERISQSFQVKHRRRDLTMTYDGYLIASRLLRKLIIVSPCRALCCSCRFRRTTNSLASDLIGSSALMPNCVAPHSNTAVTAAERSTAWRALPRNALRGGRAAARRVLSADVESGPGPQHEPLVMVGVRTAQALKAEKFRGLAPGEVTATSAAADH